MTRGNTRIYWGMPYWHLNFPKERDSREELLPSSWFLPTQSSSLLGEVTGTWIVCVSQNLKPGMLVQVQHCIQEIRFQTSQGKRTAGFLGSRRQKGRWQKGLQKNSKSEQQPQKILLLVKKGKTCREMNIVIEGISWLAQNLKDFYYKSSIKMCMAHPNPDSIGCKYEKWTHPKKLKHVVNQRNMVRLKQGNSNNNLLSVLINEVLIQRRS